MKTLITLLALNITLTWDPDPTGRSHGYKIYYTQGGRQYIGYAKTNRFTIQDTISGRIYKACASATNQCCESGKSRIITAINP